MSENTEEITPEQEFEAIRSGYQGKKQADPSGAADPVLDTEGKKDEEPAKEEAPKPDEEQAATHEQDKVIADLQKQIRDINGRYGAVNSEVDKLRKALTTAQSAGSDSGSAPSQKQIAAALSNQKEMDTLTKEYPEFIPFATALKEVHDLAASRSAPQATPPAQGIDPDVIKREAREMAKLDTKHEDWEDLIQTDAFVNFALEGGPSKDDYLALNQHRNANGTLQPGYMSKLNQMVKAHPEWWAKKGAAFFSDKAKDASRLLDAYKGSQKPQQSDNTHRKDRLRANLTPQGSGAAPAKGGETETDLIRRGYKQAAEKNRL